jgi:hypothetical protein
MRQIPQLGTQRSLIQTGAEVPVPSAQRSRSRIGKVGAFAVSGGNLAELSGSPVSLPAGAVPAGIATN